VAVRIDEFKERENGVAYIAATIFVERESQKGIVIGKNGALLKEIGVLARTGEGSRWRQWTTVRWARDEGRDGAGRRAGAQACRLRPLSQRR